ncbi:MAG: LysM domain-containing protein [Pseudomonadota bacterium]
MVKSGDTLSGIGAAHNTTANKIMNLNKLDDPNVIRPGMELIIKL